MIAKHVGWSLLLSYGLCATGLAAETVRVAVVKGVPQIQPNLSLRKERHYRVSFWARAVPERDLTIAFYRPGRVYTYLGGPPGDFASQIKLAANADVPFVSFPVHMPWPQPGQAVDWTTSDQQCQEVR